MHGTGDFDQLFEIAGSSSTTRIGLRKVFAIQSDTMTANSSLASKQA